MDHLAAVDWFTVIAAFCFWAALVWTQRLDRGFPRWLDRLTIPGLWVWVLAFVSHGEPGPVMALAAAPAFLFALWLWAHGLRRFLADDLAHPPRRHLEMLSATGPLVAAAAWIWSRYDRSFAGFPDPLATLTTVHFAITFGVLPLAMAACERPLARCRWRDLGLWLYVAGAPATALCFALRADPLRPSAVEVACAVLFAAGFLLWAAFMPVRRGPWPYVCLVPVTAYYGMMQFYDNQSVTQIDYVTDGEFTGWLLMKVQKSPFSSTNVLVHPKNCVSAHNMWDDELGGQYMDSHVIHVNEYINQ